MTLQKLMETLKTPEIKVTIMDADEVIIKFYSDGYLGVENDILERTVKSYDIVGAKAIVVNLEPATSNTSDPVQP